MYVHCSCRLNAYWSTSTILGLQSSNTQREYLYWYILYWSYISSHSAFHHLCHSSTSVQVLLARKKLCNCDCEVNGAKITMSDNNNSRRSLPRRAAKRKAEEELKDEGVKKPKQGVTDHDDVEPTCDPFTYRWIGEGTVLPNGQVEHTLLEMIIEGKTSNIIVGDTILLRSGEDADRDQAFVAKVERMWQNPPRKNTPREYGMKIRVRWYFKVRLVREWVASKLSSNVS